MDNVWRNHIGVDQFLQNWIVRANPKFKRMMMLVEVAPCEKNGSGPLRHQAFGARVQKVIHKETPLSI